MYQWHPKSWQSSRISQQANYSDSRELERVIEELTSLPPLVSESEIEQLTSKIASAARGESFILQGGDCAELFSECTAERIESKLRILLQMSMILADGLEKPVVKIGRIAGQYAKPRSSDFETVDGLTLPSYRGDLINQSDFEPMSREASPERLLKGYSFASLTLNYLRTLFDNQYKDLFDLTTWDLDFIGYSPNSKTFRGMIDQLGNRDSYECNMALQISPFNLKDRIYTCHEALHLHYEQALTRQGKNGNWYNFSTHMPWVGMRTNQLNSAHIEYIKGIDNPIAIKVGPGMTAEQLLKLADTVDPENEPGRLTLITRFGEKQIHQFLPSLVKAVKSQQRMPLWCCDPMHGNTSKTSSGRKTRRFNTILSELTSAIEIHQQLDSHLGGVHFELTGENVTECVGGARNIKENDLCKAYKSLVDPRLNAEQSLEMAFHISQLCRTTKRAKVSNFQ
jgi:3-deoxy-7-phosphoheptulonate synthase